MDTFAHHQQQLIESIKTLPEDSLLELVNFVAYLHHKARAKQSPAAGSNFLLSVAGLGTSGETDVSERDEAILANEVDPIYGWSVQPDEPR